VIETRAQHFLFGSTIKTLMNKFIPTEHMIMIWVSAAVLVLSGVAYLFAPANKSEAFLAIMTLSSGFIFGKFTNGFSRGIPKSGGNK